MRIQQTVNILLFTALTAPFAATAADLKAGQTLHDAHCLKCHDSGVYTRKDRRITSLDALRKQVARCELSLGLTWFDDQRDNVVQYLNNSYYKFP
ncbi:MAG TPA: cytochrome c [Gammaproteobacteria bacterium]